MYIYVYIYIFMALSCSQSIIHIKAKLAVGTGSPDNSYHLDSCVNYKPAGGDPRCVNCGSPRVAHERGFKQVLADRDRDIVVTSL